MKEALNNFNSSDFYSALRDFFKKLNIPVSYLAEESVRPQDILEKTYKPNHPSCKLMNDVYFLGMMDDAAFEGAKSLDPDKIESDYDGILIFGVTLASRKNGLPPTRTQLAEITRSFNREFHYTPVVVVFEYGNFIAFANAERLKYKQEWREGEKAGKVSLLRDIDPVNPHRGHIDILSRLAITRKGKKAINSFADLYAYWQTVFNVSLLNKKFYEELSNWYFWAVKEVAFPSEPNIHSLFEKTGSSDDKKLAEAIQEHKAKNVIRLLTRFLFVWFIKEKKLIPEKLFDREYLEQELLNDLSPFHDSGPQGNLFQDKAANIQSHYYKAILQNLFFATLNQEMGKRGFRSDRQHMNVTNLLRYEPCFKDTQKFVDLVESVVPFMNGGLFECLDKPHPTKKGPKGGDVIIYKDGFSDRKDNPLKVPDYLFFGLDEEVDLSSVIGIKNKKTKQAAVKGLINIFNSYKFTIAENTPIEEDIALDPELLGKVFENLLASYNPETKTTARKQTGSFYTPREIVNYMVDESLIAYLKNEVNWAITKETEEEQDAKLHELLSFDPTNPFADNLKLQKEIIKALDHCTILDPACGSGAFPMGILQKMVHVLQKLDPENDRWRELQMEKAISETESALHLDDKRAREQKLIEINDAFDQQINDPDYARKLFLIENCIYGVDIQPIAVQISKLRFFISLVVEQKVDPDKDNFGIRPLPNLETKFVAANTLIGIEKPDKQMALGSPEIKKLEQELKDVRHRIFSAKTPSTKRKLRDEDQTLREKMGELLIADGWANKTANQLAGWDPYDQNASSSFFDPEWMFGMKDGFDVVIGNPPYMRIQEIRNNDSSFADWLTINYESATGSFDLYAIFTEKGISLCKQSGILNFIMPVKWTNAAFGKGLRSILLEQKVLGKIISFDEHQVFNASTYTGIHFFDKKSTRLLYNQLDTDLLSQNELSEYLYGLLPDNFNNYSIEEFDEKSWTLTDNVTGSILKKIYDHETTVEDVFEKIFQGIATSKDSVYFLTDCFVKNDLVEGFSKELGKRVTIELLIAKPLLKGDQVHKYCTLSTTNYVIFPYKRVLNKSVLLTETEMREQFPLACKYLKLNESVLRGRENGRLKNDKHWFRYIYPKNQTLFDKEKLVAPDVSMGGNFAYDKNGTYYSTTTIYGYIKRRAFTESYYYYLGVLNSDLLWWYLQNTGTVLANGYFRFKPDYLKPFPLPKAEKWRLLDLLSRALTYIKEVGLNNKFNILNVVSNAFVLESYFTDHMQEKQIDILPFVEKDLAEVMQDRDFGQLTDPEKEEIINLLHSRWTHPDSEVRNRIKLFAVRSPDILKPILESK